jgi:ppGpp synthetase/RelA/SpoT-type nucleotidyltranferase
MIENKLEDWDREYKSKINGYEKFEKLLKSLIEKLLEMEGVSTQVSSRTKSAISFREKIERKDKTGNAYDNPMSEVTDIVGIRIITYYLEDIDRICSIIKKEFEIDEKNSLDKSAILAIDQFGYKSVHYIVSLSSVRRDLPEWTEFSKFKAEIQVRTILQHAWAEIDHEIRYKKEENIPVEIKRRVYRLMALFELADEEFQNLKYDTEALKGKYLRDITFGVFKIKLSSLSLSAYFSFTKQDEKWMTISNRLINEIYESYQTDLNILVKFSVEKYFFNYRIDNLEKLLNRLEVKDLMDFDQILQDADQWGKDALRQAYKAFLDDTIDLTQDGTYEYVFDPYLNISILVCHAKAELIRANPLILENIDYMYIIKKGLHI